MVDVLYARAAIPNLRCHCEPRMLFPRRSNPHRRLEIASAQKARLAMTDLELLFLPEGLLSVTMPPMTRHRTLILLVILFFAFALRVLSLDAQSMWRDEIDTFCFTLDFWSKLEQAAASPVSETNAPLPVSERPRCQPTPGLSRIDPSQGVWPTLRALLTLPGWNGPLYTVVVRPWVGLTGYSPFALRYSSLFFGLLAVPLTYVLGRRLLGEAVGLIGAALLAFSPHLVWYSQEAKMYAAVLAWGLLALYALRRAIDGDGGARWWAVVVGAATLALYHHILAALLIPLLVVLGVIWWPRTRAHWRGALLALACLTLPYLPLLAWQVDSWLSPAGQATLFATRRLDVMLAATLKAWGGNFVGEPWATQILAALAFLAMCGLTWDWLTAREGGEWRESLALLAWAGLPLLGVWAISARQPIFVNRYMIWAAPAFYLLAAAGAVALTRQPGGRVSQEAWVRVIGRVGQWLAGGLLLLILIGDGRALLHQATQPIKPDFRAAAACVEAGYRPEDLLIFHLSYMQHNFDFYYDADYEGWGAPAPGEGMTETDLDFYMRTQVSGHRTVWLVLSEAEMWDPRGLVKQWLDEHALAPPEEWVFAHVSVYRYQQNDVIE